MVFKDTWNFNLDRLKVKKDFKFSKKQMKSLEKCFQSNATSFLR